MHKLVKQFGGRGTAPDPAEELTVLFSHCSKYSVDSACLLTLRSHSDMLGSYLVTIAGQLCLILGREL